MFEYDKVSECVLVRSGKTRHANEMFEIVWNEYQTEKEHINAYLTWNNQELETEAIVNVIEWSF